MSYLGEVAALGTACCWVASSIGFSEAGRRSGSRFVNVSRLVLAFCVVFLVLLFMGELPDFPSSWEESRGWLFLLLSGVVGYSLGDAFLFQSFLYLGPQLSMLIMTLSPFLAGFFAFWFLGESLPLGKVGVMFVALGGIALTILSRKGSETAGDRKWGRGIVFAFLGACGQGGGIVLAKGGMEMVSHPLAANGIRLLGGLFTLLLVEFVILRSFSSYWRELNSPPSKFFPLIAATFCGPVLGVFLSLVAVKYANVAVSSTIMQLTPVLLIPFSWLVFKERFGVGTWVGTLVAVGGSIGLVLGF